MADAREIAKQTARKWWGTGGVSSNDSFVKLVDVIEAALLAERERRAIIVLANAGRYPFLNELAAAIRKESQKDVEK